MNDIVSTKVEQTKDLKRKAILKAAAKIFSQKGYMDSSIKDITNEASVSVGSFYSYFNNKEDVLSQIYEEISDMSLKAASNASMTIKDNVVKKFTFAMTSAICTYANNKEFSKILFVKSMGINDLFEKKRWDILDKTNIYLKGVLEHLNEVHSSGINDINVTSVLLTNSLFGVISYWLNEKLVSNFKDMIFSLCTYHLRALNINFTDDEVNRYINQILMSDYKELLE
ncbi:TetR/AcrR family transcriptional regulator [Clostridium botulinum]|uniref:TetR/AcrR family transcriptional regulator n=1 Tax=Clostridium botulinum TaxID=1491 RepID=UPI000774CBBF|nr:TetR/AcrR family transcriptional regulator [Clostridium botulinum]MBY6809292.1 TetR/AcrR family transcriptional regulator [Clostridium botulinum]MBY6822734.1 TetR/AcrR family transcriptional regulator [Clostridium botulinum]MBY6833346.1 TetR/AcrR family transcriptional regulator [Clostridium botulinum]MBY6971407.1 TetR/AcrR family transcriptional regulator [Clostridium botulinum]MCS6102726.1 TetR/AcrR family transcriptional regulator [Clostridium botulinum]